MQEMLRQLHRILDEFPDHVIIGGLAATLLGAPRTTVDVDLVLLLSPQEADRVVALCERYGFSPSPGAAGRLSEGRPVKFAFSRRFSLDIRLASFSIDRAAIRRAQTIPLYGHPMRIATPEDFIVYKLARWNALDREDVRHVLQRLADTIDITYVEEQVRLLGQEADLPHLIEHWHAISAEFFQ